MKKGTLALPLALVLAGSMLAGCGPKNAAPTVTVEKGYVYLDGEKTDVEAVAPHTPSVTVKDGYVYVDGVKTDVAVHADPQEQKSAFELWKEENPTYSGTEAEWLAWLTELVSPKEEAEMTYSLIENGKLNGFLDTGSAQTENGSVKLTDASVRLQEGVVLPFGENASWEVAVSGKLLTGTAGGAQFFAGNPFTEEGRVYLGVNKGSSLIYVGVRLGSVYVNYGWEVSSGAFFNNEHSYVIRYADGTYTLSLDGAEAKPMKEINFNQEHGQWISDVDVKTLGGLVRTVAAQDSVEMTHLGVDGFLWNAEISSFTVKTSADSAHKHLLAHPLSQTKIFYLGSSITRGEASNGVAFGELLHSLTGNPFVKEAVSGTTLVDNGTSSYVQRLKNLDFAEKPDYLVVQLSTNDFSQGKPLDPVQDGTASTDFNTSTVSGAIQYIIAYAKEQCPTCKVVFYTGAVKSNWGFRTQYGEYINNQFKTICEKWDIEPLDIFHASYKSYDFFMSDDIHPTIEGYAFGWTPLFMQYFMDRI